MTDSMKTRSRSRFLMACLWAVVAAFGLSACETMADAAPTVAPVPVAGKSTVDLLLEVRSKELDLERTDQMAWLKFAAESGSDMVKGFVMGRSAGKGAGGGGDQGGGTTQVVMQAQAQADATALRREEMAIQNSAWNKGMQLLDRGGRLFMFSKGLGFQKFQITESNAQNRYTLDALRGTQQDGYSFGSNAYSSGSASVLSGVSAGSAAASAGAAAVAGGASGSGSGSASGDVATVPVVPAVPVVAAE